MRKTVTNGLLLTCLLASGPLWAAKSCSELKEQIDANIYGNGVRGYLLEVLPNEYAERELNEGSGAKIVGSCGGGTQKIVYWRDGKPDSALNKKAQAVQTPQQESSTKPAQRSSLDVLLTQ